ncbi:MAG: hypothetical protein JWM19_3327 [Actinomycetia bacterium]|nr:hypothetical protein [Actinomycetes bacterium]
MTWQLSSKPGVSASGAARGRPSRGGPGTVCGRPVLAGGCHGVIAMGPGSLPTRIGVPGVLVVVLIGVTVPEPELLT